MIPLERRLPRIAQDVGLEYSWQSIRTEFSAVSAAILNLSSLTKLQYSIVTLFNMG